MPHATAMIGAARSEEKCVCPRADLISAPRARCSTLFYPDNLHCEKNLSPKNDVGAHVTVKNLNLGQDTTVARIFAIFSKDTYNLSC